MGLFSKHGLNVELRREVGWATVREKIIYGELDAAQAPAPMLWSTHLGLGCSPCEVVTAFVLNLHGNALTLSSILHRAGVRNAAGLKDVVRSRKAQSPLSPLTFGVVYGFSSHHLLLREWLRRGGIDPDRDVRIVIVPPAQMFRNLEAGTIDGYCAGEPWNSLAVRSGAGWCPVWSCAFDPGHVEKVLMVTRRFAEQRSAEHGAMVAALDEACAWCDEPQNREPLAEMLARAEFLNLPARLIAPPLLGRFDRGDGTVEDVPDFHVFHRGEANVPGAAKALALQEALLASGLLSGTSVPSDLGGRLFREDLHRTALRTRTAST
jgi:two-component system, oxyanion-binding sensor